MRKQKGLVAIFITIAFSLMLGFAALAIDVNDMVLNKAKLQNAVDAAAIAAAAQATVNDSATDAENAAISLLTTYDDVVGNTSLSLPSSKGTQLSIQFSNDSTTFSGTANQAKDIYARVELTAYPLQSYFLGIFGLDKNVTVSAVAGPIYTDGSVCNVVPIGVCSLDDSNSDHGYKINKAYALKLKGTNDVMGPGNFQLLDIGTIGGGGDEVELGLAGAGDTCLNVDGVPSVYSKTGGTVGSVKEGVNTRFGDYPTDVPSGYSGTLDEYKLAYNQDPYNITEVTDNGYDMTYNEAALDDAKTDAALIDAYQNAVSITAKSGNSSTNLNTYDQGYSYWGYDDYNTSSVDPDKSRRVVVAPIINCDGDASGKSLYQIEDFACFFLLNKAPSSNNSGNKSVLPLIGQRIESCTINNGTSSGDSGVTDGSYKIVLFKDPLNQES